MGTYTSNKNLYEPAVGETNWGVSSSPSVNNNFTIIDKSLGSTAGFSLSSSDIVLSTENIQNLRLSFTGTLLTNVNVIFPTGAGGCWIISNATLGNFAITLKTATSGATIPLQNRLGNFTVFSDGINMYLVDNVTPAGMIQAFGGTTVPFGWLNCNGASYSSITYPALFAAIGTTWGGSGSNFNVPDLQGIFLRGSGTNATYATAVGPVVGGYQADKLFSHTHTVNDPGHSHIIGSSYPSVSSGSNALNTTGGAGITPTTFTANTGITINSQGSADSNPKNYGVLYCIKT